MVMVSLLMLQIATSLLSTTFVPSSSWAIPNLPRANDCPRGLSSTSAAEVLKCSLAEEEDDWLHLQQTNIFHRTFRLGAIYLFTYRPLHPLAARALD
jgi:hypothetical protein